MKHIDLFSGIGGFAFAAQSVWGADYEPLLFCDSEEFCQAVLEKHWPDAPIYDDIRTLTRQRYIRDFGECQKADLLTGGFPCQPFSVAGRRRGTEDERFLWPEMLRVIQEFSPRWVIAENVRGLLSQERGLVFEQVCSDLEALTYDVLPFVIPAAGVGAPHRRERVWIVAHANVRESNTGNVTEPRKTPYKESGANHTVAPDTVVRWLRRHERESAEEASASRDSHPSLASDAVGVGRRRRSNGDTTGSAWQIQVTRSDTSRDRWQEPWLEAATRLCRVDDGLPRRMDRTPRLKALGNAIVPQVAQVIMNAIKSTDTLDRDSGI